jgi:hypothetical protein
MEGFNHLGFKTQQIYEYLLEFNEFFSKKEILTFAKN